MNSITINSFVNLFFLSYLILQPAINKLLIGFDGAGRSIAILAIAVLLTNFSETEFWRTGKNKPVLIWGIWCLYVSIAWIIIGERTSVEVTPIVFIFNFIFLPFLSLYVTCYEVRKSPVISTKVLLYSFIVYCILGLVLQTPSNVNVRGGEILGNDMPLTAVCMLTVAALRYVKKWDKPIIFYACLLLCTLAVVMAATRKAFGGELIIIAAVILSLFDIRKSSNFILMIALFICTYLAFGFIMDNTLLGARMGEIDESAEIYNTTNSPILNLLGDRAYFYINGWQLFTEHPIFGIGIFNFRAAMNIKLPIHSEYIVQICETGIIGSVLFILFYYYTFKSIKQTKFISDERSTRMVSYGWLLTLLFISLTAWTYQFPRYFIVTGMVLGYCGNILDNSLNNSCDK